MNTYKRHRFHPSIISYAVWVFYRFNLSFRDVEDLLADKGISVSHYRRSRTAAFVTWRVVVT
jgi:putative transposase